MVALPGAKPSRFTVTVVLLSYERFNRKTLGFPVAAFFEATAETRPSGGRKPPVSCDREQAASPGN